MVMWGIILLLTTAALGVPPTHSPVPANHCESVRPLGAEFEESKAVFAGTVIRITKPRPDEYVENGRLIYEDKMYIYVTFEVKRAWKGVREGVRLITVEAEREEFGCGIDFKVGGAYLVYAGGAGGGKDGRLWVDCCTRTGRVEEAGRDLRQLEAVRPRRVARRRG
jgi:hypothetical protein